ncbi:MAG: hypothetical protein ACXW00_10355 [Methylobacter sp.]
MAVFWLPVAHSAKGVTLNSTEIFDPKKNLWQTGPDLNKSRVDHTATLLSDGRLFIVGGNASGTAEIFDITSSVFKTIAKSGLHIVKAGHSEVLLIDGKVLIVGWKDGRGVMLRSAEIFDPVTEHFSLIEGGLGSARIHPELKLLPDGKVQLIGGDMNGTFEIFNAEPIRQGFRFNARSSDD